MLDMLPISLRGIKVSEVSKKADPRSCFFESSILVSQSHIKLKDCQVDPIGFAPLFLRGIKVFVVSERADPRLCFWKFNFSFSITYEMERLSSGPLWVRSAPPFRGINVPSCCLNYSVFSSPL